MKKLNILYEDKDFIAVAKPSGMLTVSDGKEYENTLFHELITFQKQKNKNNKIYTVHRLDKDTSGIVLFAKNESVKFRLQNEWENVKREYIALVNGNVKKDKDTLKSYLKETSTYLVYSVKDKGGKLAITKYEKIKSNNNFTLLKINIQTGRKNQIRVQLNDIGHPIVGDKKYGNKKSPFRELCLHASLLEFVHPQTKKVVKIESSYPRFYDNVL